MRYKILISTIVYLLLSQQVLCAAPSITSLSGNFADNKSISINGQNFGSSPQQVSFLTFENGTLNGIFSEPGWTYSAASLSGVAWKSPIYSNAKVHNGTKSILCAYPDAVYGCAFTASFPKPVQKAYVTFWVYGDVIQWPPAPAKAIQWKMWRVNGGSTIDHKSPTFYINNWPKTDGISCLQAQHLNYPSNVGVTSVITPTNSYRKCWPMNQWLRFEIFLEESAIGAANGTQVVKYYSSSANQWIIWSNYGKNVTTKTYDSPWKYFWFGHYVGNPDSGKIVNTYWDNVYIQQGTYARVEVGDNSSWANCSKREIQKPNTWTNNQITIQVNTGNFTQGQKLYLFVIDDAGNASTGWPLNQGTTAPPVSGTPQ